jgi:hypothetical protein
VEVVQLTNNNVIFARMLAGIIVGRIVVDMSL